MKTLKGWNVKSLIFQWEQWSCSAANGTEMCVGELGEKPWRSLWRRLHLSSLEGGSFPAVREYPTGQVAEREHCAREDPQVSLSVRVLSKEACYRRTWRENQEQLLRILSSPELVVRHHYCQHRKGKEVESPLNPWSPFCGIYPKIAGTRKRSILIFWGNREVGCPKP